MYSFVVPIYNDGDLAEAFCEEFYKVFSVEFDTIEINNLVEVIFVNDGSEKASLEQLKIAANKFNFVRIIDLSRNFGQHIAITCGYRHAIGEFVGMINVDMQDPPDQIPKLLGRINKGDIDIVLGLRTNRQGKLWDVFTSRLFAYSLNWLTNVHEPLQTATLRIMSRRFVNSFNELAEKNRFIPGLERWLGFAKDYVPIENRRRLMGKSTYTTSKRFSMAVESILSFSDFPLRLLIGLGGLIAILGFLFCVVLIVRSVVFSDLLHGYASTISIVILLGGVQILVTGISGLYIGRILKEVQNRPLYIIREKINFKTPTHVT